MANSKNAILSSRLLLLKIDFDIYAELHCLLQWFLTRGRPPREGVDKFPGRREPLRALQHGMFD